MQPSFDLVVIGRGISGLMAAAEASRIGASVAVVFDSLVNSSSLAYEGVFRFTDNPSELENKVLEQGCGLAKRELVSRFIGNCRDAHYEALSRDFPLVNSSPIGKKHKLGGSGILADLEVLCASHGVSFIGGKTTRISATDGAVTAVQVFRYPRLITIPTKSVVLATGGGVGNLYRETNNFTSYCSPGALLALNAGARLRDVEYVSFHPFGVTDHYTFHNTTPIFTFFNIGVKTRIYGNQSNARLHDVEDLIATRTAEKNAHDNIFGIARRVWRNGGVHFTRTRNGGAEEIRLKAVAHSLIGGIDTDCGFQTSVRGLFSVGEASGGLNGAGRLPGMALLEGFVSGREAGAAACAYVSETGFSAVDPDDLIPPATRFGMLSHVLEEARTRADTALFIERNEPALRRCEARLLDLMSRVSRKHIAQYMEYDLLEMALAITRASLLRTESRGFFVRNDHPARDENMERSILVQKRGPSSEIELHWEDPHA